MPPKTAVLALQTLGQVTREIELHLLFTRYLVLVTVFFELYGIIFETLFGLDVVRGVQRAERELKSAPVIGGKIDVQIDFLANFVPAIEKRGFYF